MKDFLGTMTLIAVFGFICFMFGYSTAKENKACTVTITDMQGVRHQIKGVADNE